MRVYSSTLTQAPCVAGNDDRRELGVNRGLNAQVMDAILDFLTASSPYIEQFRFLSQQPHVDAHLEFEVTDRATAGNRAGDRNPGIETHAVLSNDDAPTSKKKLVVWAHGQDRKEYIDFFSPLMEPFQYPLLFPEGSPGWHERRLNNMGGKLSQLEYSRCLLLSEPRFSTLGRLSQAWMVEMFARFEEQRLRYIKSAQEGKNQTGQRRFGPLNVLQDAIRTLEERQLQQQQAAINAPDQIQQDIQNDPTIQGDGGPQPGKIYLPSSYVGGPRYMRTQYNNAMKIVGRRGPPDLFLTFTYSGRWEENKKADPNGSGKSDPATACRIFKIKLNELIRDIRSGALFGRPGYIVYTIEFQQKGFPYCHLALRLKDFQVNQASEIDKLVRADIPTEDEADGILRNEVLINNIHGPCGTDHRTDFLCWDKDKQYCQKHFPKPACEVTHADSRGFVTYRRDWNNKGYIRTQNRDIEVHDGWVVPYNAAIMLKYRCHHNLEIASTRKIIKYLFKYLMKGGSLQNVTITPFRDQQDEVTHYITKRMIGASDACWRLFGFDLTRMEPTAETLPVHLENRQIVFKPGQLNGAMENPKSKLNLYLERPNDPIFDNLTYQDFYEQWYVETKQRGKGKIYNHPSGRHFVFARQRGEAVCGLYWCTPNQGEIFYLRLLLGVVPCRGYADLLSKGGPDCTTFQEVARNLGLIDDIMEYHHALQEASLFLTGPRLRSFFVLLCLVGAPARLLWDDFKDLIAEDHIERNLEDPERAYDLALLDIGRALVRQGSSLTEHGLKEVEDDTTELGRELMRYGENRQRQFVEEWEPRLSEDQRAVFRHVCSLLDAPPDSLPPIPIFIDGPGGFGKTLLVKVILAEVRARHEVTVAVASSGIAAGNMPGGATAHSMLRLPLDLKDGTGVWNITNGTQRAELIRSARVIIFDEAPMAHRFIFDIIDRSLRDLMGNDELFGGKIFICCGDFRQIAPVEPKARTPSDVIDVSLRSSPLWPYFKQFHLTTPQRTSGDSAYTDFLLKVGNGEVPHVTFGEGREKETLIPLSPIPHVSSIEELMMDVFPPHVLRDPEACSQRAILATININVDDVNSRILELISGPVHELLSVDKSKQSDGEQEGMEVDPDILNQAGANGVPPHVLKLKVGAVCLIMRNLNVGDGLANGTKVIVTAISRKLVTVKKPGDPEPHGIPRINFEFDFCEGSPLKVSRRQFPLRLAYSMSGHKSQGQTISYVGIDLRTDCFTHGQLYVLLSRVRSPNDIKIFVPEAHVHDGIPYAKNIVYKELLL